MEMFLYIETVHPNDLHSLSYSQDTMLMMVHNKTHAYKLYPIEEKNIKQKPESSYFIFGVCVLLIKYMASHNQTTYYVVIAQKVAF